MLITCKLTKEEYLDIFKCLRRNLIKIKEEPGQYTMTSEASSGIPILIHYYPNNDQNLNNMNEDHTFYQLSTISDNLIKLSEPTRTINIKNWEDLQFVVNLLNEQHNDNK